MNEKKVTEIFLATILVLLLIVLIFLFTSQSISGKTSSTSTSTTSSTTNSHNTNSYNTYYISSYPPTQEYYESYRDPNYIKEDKNYLIYRSGSDRTRVEGFLGNDIDKYVVYVQNDDYKGGYFTVRFYFTDYYGRTFTEPITHYIKPHEEERFLYKDFYADRYRHYDWDYEVISHTKVPKSYADSIRTIDIDDSVRVSYIKKYE